ncbi:unnamed protein product [Pedinophyceae sp. YPF-701]|nr:unnamed protein product [Pedinophyceae sp. YPF-701]
MASASAAAQPDVEKMTSETEAYDEGVKQIKAGNMEAAITALSRALELCVEKFGESDPRCAQTYFKYGSALLWKCQDEADAFGGTMIKEAVQAKAVAEILKQQEEGLAQAKAQAAAPAPAKSDDGAGPSEPPASAAARDEAGPSEPVAKAGDAGAAGGENEGSPDEEGSSSDDDDDDDGDDGEGENEGSGEGSAPDDDLTLSWQMLDMARAIWARDEAAHAASLVECHMLLGEQAMERESFGDAAAEFRSALRVAERRFPGNMRMAYSAHFFACSALQYAEELDGALEHAAEALAACEAHRDMLARGEVPKGDEERYAVDGKMKQDLEDLAATLEDLREKVQDIKDHRESRKAALEGDAAPAGAGASPFDKPTLGAGGASGAGPSGVQDLGVIGKTTVVGGKKRINLAAQQEAVPQAALQQALANVTGASAEKVDFSAAGKRALEVGGVAAGAPEAKRARAEGPENEPAGEKEKEKAPAAVPAFLQAYRK